MAKKRGRPPLDPKSPKAIHIALRIEVPEKQAFQEAAKLAGLGLSAWIRERLRRVARKELEDFGRPVPFLKRHKDGDR